MILSRFRLVSNAHWPLGVRYINLNKHWPFTDGYADAVYASHVFEHLALNSADLFLKEARRVLKSGGALRIVVPDLLAHAKQYIGQFESNPNAAAEFLWAINLQMPPQRNAAHLIYSIFNGFPSMHKTMYDESSLRRRLMDAGFTNIQVKSRAVSDLIPEVALLEAGDGYACSLYLEARKH